MVGPEGNAIGKPVRPEVQHQSDQRHEQHAASAAKRVAANRQQRDQEGHQNRSSQCCTHAHLHAWWALINNAFHVPVSTLRIADRGSWIADRGSTASTYSYTYTCTYTSVIPLFRSRSRSHARTAYVGCALTSAH